MRVLKHDKSMLCWLFFVSLAGAPALGIIVAVPTGRLETRAAMNACSVMPTFRNGIEVGVLLLSNCSMQVADTNYSPEEQEKQQKQKGNKSKKSPAGQASAQPPTAPASQDTQAQEQQNNTASSQEVIQQATATADGAAAGATQGSQASEGVVSEQPAEEDEVTRAEMCALCKLHVELDRTESAREAGYAAGLYRLFHSKLQAKGDLLVGLPRERAEWQALHGLLG